MPPRAPRADDIAPRARARASKALLEQLECFPEQRHLRARVEQAEEVRVCAGLDGKPGLDVDAALPDVLSDDGEAGWVERGGDRAVDGEVESGGRVEPEVDGRFGLSVQDSDTEGEGRDEVRFEAAVDVTAGVDGELELYERGER